MLNDNSFFKGWLQLKKFWVKILLEKDFDFPSKIANMWTFSPNFIQLYNPYFANLSKFNPNILLISYCKKCKGLNLEIKSSESVLFMIYI